MNKKQPLVLCILDGFGLNPDTEGNAVKLANPQNFLDLWNKYPHTTLITHGERVGLPAGQMGNSEVGHMNIGAGRVVEQWLVRISKILKEDRLGEIESYKTFLENTKKSETIHLIGLCSNGGVHSHISHLQLLITRLVKDFREKIAVHFITDGRDTGPNSGKDFISDLQTFIEPYRNVKIASICGRFWAMDRDNRWERIEKAYRLYCEGLCEHRESNPLEAIQKQYQTGITDEFIEPCIIDKHVISADDGVIFFNFREDRMRQLTFSLCQKQFSYFQRSVVVDPKNVLCFSEYDKNYPLPFLFYPQSLDNHLGEVISKVGLKQLRVAETEKYPHVTYFFNGGIETPYPNEERKVAPSPKDVKTYDLKPQMSAYEVLDIVLKEGINSDSYDFVVVNFANCDMVGHSGNLNSAIKAVQVVDDCLGQIAKALEAKQGILVVIADHGNAEQMIQYDTQKPHTAHTTFYVPMIVCDWKSEKNIVLKEDGALGNVAPTILDLMGIAKPSQMSELSLIGTRPLKT